MINRERMLEEFLFLTGTDSLSRRERQQADNVLSILRGLGYAPEEDDTAKSINGDAGNIICHIKGTKKVPSLLFAAHMDTVEPGIGKVRVIDGDYVRTDGTTILGADNVAGIVSILEALRQLQEENLEHGDIYALFTVAEEGGLFGAKNLDIARIPVDYGFVMDGGGSVENVVIQAPYQSKGAVTIIGKAAHAGIAPEDGVSAIQVFAKAVSGMKHGRIDSETTANIGTIQGGLASNIVCETVQAVMEVRSASKEKLDNQLAHMRECFESAAKEFGAHVSFDLALAYPGFSIPTDAPICKLVRKGASCIGIEPQFQKSGGGYDANIMNDRGIPTVILSVGTEEAHTVNEYLHIPDMVKAAELLTAIIKAVE